MNQEGPDPTARFSSRAEDYTRYRPGYPPELVPLLAREIGLAPDWTVVDVGSGTGLSAEPFLEHGNRVIAVEPNAAMRAVAEARLGRHPRFVSVDGRAEATGLEAEVADLVVAAQAFHWFDAARAREEFQRILRPGGWVAVIWNTRRIEDTAFLRAYEELLLRHGTDYARVRHDQDPDHALRALFPGGYERRVLPNAQTLDRDGLRGRLFSTSYTPGPEDPRREPMGRAIEELFREHAEDGAVTLVYDTEVHFARL